MIIDTLRHEGPPVLGGNRNQAANRATAFFSHSIPSCLNVIDALIKPTVYLLAPVAVRAKIHDTVHILITGLFAVLLIFVLAQIFRRGSDMRAELAGTI